MDRNKLLRIIQKDLQELTEITDELAGKKQISTHEIEFALGKSRIVCQEFEYLKELNQQPLPPEEKVSTDSSILEETAEDAARPEDTANETANAEAGIQEDRIYPEPEEELPSLIQQTEQEIPFSVQQPAEETPLPVQETEDEPHTTQQAEEEEETPLPVHQTEEVKGETRETDDKKTVSEIFVHEKSVNDLLGTGKTIEHKLTGSPLTKLKVAIGLNDRFLFIRELFNNDARLFNDTIDQIDRMENINEAIALLNRNFKWKKNETSMKFAQLVKRRFS